MTQTEMIWEFETQRLHIKLEIMSSESPDISWMDELQLAEYVKGLLIFFDAKCVIYGPRNEVLAEDWLCGNSYYEGNINEFITAHRDKDPMNRNCSIMRKAKGENQVICHYFPDMVRQACREARQHIKLQLENYSNIAKHFP